MGLESTQIDMAETGFLANISRESNIALSRAIDCYDDTAAAEQILIGALTQKGEDLGLYVALYKFYFYKKRFVKARAVAYQTLRKAAELGDFETEWPLLKPEVMQVNSPESAERVYLYTMKALGFIYLRINRCNIASAILRKLRVLDPDDRTGGSVVMDLAHKVCEN